MGKFKPMHDKILVIDDNTDLTGIISIILNAEGFKSKTCDTLEGCQAEIQKWNPDLLLLDVNVNGEDGRIFCRQLKATNSDTKIILMSGDETTLDHTHWFGADDCIAKPFDSADLLQKIHYCLEASTKNT